MCLKQAGHAKSIHPATAALFHNMYLPRSLLTERIRIMDGFLVKRPGFLTTVQDKGRFGYQWSGLSPAGAMDLHSMRLANLLVGNDMDEAALEITIIGPTLEFHANAVIAITGADLSPVLDGVSLPTYQAVPVRSGANWGNSVSQKRPQVRLPLLFGRCRRIGYSTHFRQPLYPAQKFSGRRECRRTDVKNRRSDWIPKPPSFSKKYRTSSHRSRTN